MATREEINQILRTIVANLTNKSGAIAQLSKQDVDDDGYVAAMARALVLHFDLENSKHRSEVYRLVEEKAEELGAQHLGGSVYLFPFSPGVGAGAAAARVWNEIQAATAGELRAGDTFFIQYAADEGNLGNIAQTVQPSHQALHRVVP